MRFNKPAKTINNESTSSSSSDADDTFTEKDLIAIDTLKIDNHYRITLTKKVQDVLSSIIKKGDTIAIYKNRNNNDLVFEFQRGKHGTIIDRWLIKRNFATVLEKKGLATIVQTFEPSVQEYVSREISKEDRKKKLLEKNEHQDLMTTATSKKILIVDDDNDVLLTFKTYLYDEGYKVETVNSAEQALKRFSEIKNTSYFDLVIIDIRMPNINGLQLYHLLKAMNPDIQVLFVSALDASEELVSMLPQEESSSHIIRKPVTREEFITKIKYLIRNGNGNGNRSIKIN